MKVLIALVFSVLLVACDSETNDKKDAVKQGELLFNKKHIGVNKVIGCVSCHSVKPDQVIVGPSLSGLSIRAPHLVSGQTGKEYIKNSIINPDSYVVGGYLPAVMFPHYAQELSNEEIDALVEYLSLL